MVDLGLEGAVMEHKIPRLDQYFSSEDQGTSNVQELLVEHGAEYQEPSLESKIVKGSFAPVGVEIGDMRAKALADWLCAREGATADEIKAEMERLRRIMPAPEDSRT